jgi:dipeptidase E
MKSFFFTSITENVLHGLPKLIGRKPTSTKIAFIPTAGDPYEDKSFIETDRKKWLESGYIFTELDIKNKDESQLRKALEDMDIIYLSGGNVFYLLQEANKCGLKNVIKDHLKQGKVYAGGSAGAAIAGPSLEPLQTIDDPEKAPELKDFTAFGFVDFVVLPHFDYGKYNVKYQKILKQYEHFKFQPLNNDQAIFVSNEKMRVLNSKDM